MINTIKVFLVIIFLFGLMIPLSLYLQTSKNEDLLNYYQDGKIREACPDSPDKQSFQLCFRKDLAKALGAYTPNDSLKILATLKEVYRLDLLHGEEIKETNIVNLEYFENWILVIENSRNLGINRNDSSFFDIILVPYVKYRYKNEIKSTIQQFDSFKNHADLSNNNPTTSQRWARVQSKLSKIKID